MTAVFLFTVRIGDPAINSCECGFLFSDQKGEYLNEKKNKKQEKFQNSSNGGGPFFRH